MSCSKQFVVDKSEDSDVTLEANFIEKLARMVREQEATTRAVTWTVNGESVLVYDCEGLNLRRYFNHDNFSSLARQLNMYGFTKRAGRRSDTFQCSFYHPLFHRDHPENWSQIYRGMPRANPPAVNEDLGLQEELDAILTEHRASTAAMVAQFTTTMDGLAKTAEALNAELTRSAEREQNMSRQLARIERFVQDTFGAENFQRIQQQLEHNRQQAQRARVLPTSEAATRRYTARSTPSTPLMQASRTARRDSTSVPPSPRIQQRRAEPIDSISVQAIPAYARGDQYAHARQQQQPQQQQDPQRAVAEEIFNAFSPTQNNGFVFNVLTNPMGDVFTGLNLSVGQVGHAAEIAPHMVGVNTHVRTAWGDVVHVANEANVEPEELDAYLQRDDCREPVIPRRQ
eukprot:Opistho-1_new@8757